MVSPLAIPVTPSSVTTRTIEASKRRRGDGSQAAANGGSSGSRRRCDPNCRDLHNPE